MMLDGSTGVAFGFEFLNSKSTKGGGFWDSEIARTPSFENFGAKRHKKRGPLDKKPRATRENSQSHGL